MIQAPLGTSDILPGELARWRRVEAAAHDLMARFGYQEIRTPMFEFTSLFVRSVGDTTDIVEKEMYTFDAGSTESVTFRPEFTASVVRAYLEHNLHKQRPFQKLYYLGPSFRRERPQKGRSRQFHQFGVEALGSGDPWVDVETILVADAFFAGCGLSGTSIRLNSLGCPECRPRYRDAVRAALEPDRGRLCENCRRRFDRNVFRILDCKAPACHAIAEKVPAIGDSLCDRCRSHDRTVRDGLDASGLKGRWSPDTRLVRGFDYYTKTVYEFTAPNLGSQNAVGGGGRYDNLIAELGGPALGAVGFAIGLERTLIALAAQEKAGETPNDPTVDVYVVTVEPGPVSRAAAFSLATDLRRAGLSVDLDFEDRSMKSQMRTANRFNAAIVCILGPDELARGVVNCKSMSEGTSESIPRGEAAARLPDRVAAARRATPAVASKE
ncbi:MAG: histidine--tRNA ligase [Planctomycetes bacterium]|nr:histidine--tRNA ligase [Planctomycetota bacterium]